MLLDIPIWLLLLILICSFGIIFLITTCIGVKILYSIFFGFLTSDAIAISIHTFDVKDGKIIPHTGDFEVAIFLAINSICIYLSKVFKKYKLVSKADSALIAS